MRDSLSLWRKTEKERERKRKADRGEDRAERRKSGKWEDGKRGGHDLTIGRSLIISQSGYVGLRGRTISLTDL